MSPFTLNIPRVPQIFWTSNGMRTITQFKRDAPRSRSAWNDFAEDLVGGCTGAQLLLCPCRTQPMQAAARLNVLLLIAPGGVRLLSQSMHQYKKRGRLTDEKTIVIECFERVHRS